MAASNPTQLDNRIKHGACRNGRESPEYTSWKGMKRRCCDRNFKDYHLYGGKGIAVCQRWLGDFATFLKDMGPKPFPEASIHRIDGDGNYEPGNCKWASKGDQSFHASTTRKITFKGETRSLRGWARKIGINTEALRMRLIRGWAIEKALATPPMPPSRSGGAIMITYDDETMPLQEWARRCGIKPATILARLKKLGWSVEETLTTPTQPRPVKHCPPLR